LQDGYNVISKWRVTLKARSAGGNAQARSCLAEQLRYLVSARRWKCIVAYDEHTPGSVLRVIDEADVEEVFTGESMSADSYIEKKAKELVGKQQGTVMVRIWPDLVMHVQ
jgi:predicted RNA-binding protein with PIN domain